MPPRPLTDLSQLNPAELARLMSEGTPIQPVVLLEMRPDGQAVPAPGVRFTDGSVICLMAAMLAAPVLAAQAARGPIDPPGPLPAPPYPSPTDFAAQAIDLFVEVSAAVQAGVVSQRYQEARQRYGLASAAPPAADRDTREP